MHEATGKRYTAEARRTALAWLQETGLAHPEQCPLPQGGPAAECWHPGPPTADRKPQTVVDDDDDVVPTANRKPQTVPSVGVAYPTPTLIVEVQADSGSSGAANRQPLTVSQSSSSTDRGADRGGGSMTGTDPRHDDGLRSADCGGVRCSEAEDEGRGASRGEGGGTGGRWLCC